MKRKILVYALPALIVAAIHLAEAQQIKVARIGRISAGSPNSDPSRDEALRQGLRDLGYIEGKNIIVETRYADGQLERYAALAAEFVRLNVDVIVAASAPARAARRATRTIPIVVVGTTDPVATGLVESLARPGGNVTGLTPLSPELSGKRLELVKETIPKFSRAAFLFDLTEPSNVLELEQLRSPAAALGVTLQIRGVQAAEEMEQAFSLTIREGSQALILAAGALINNNRKRITAFSTKNKLPTVFSVSQFVEDGGLMSYGPNLHAMYRRAAFYVDKILKGTRPADLPVEQPMKFEFAINLKTAKQIGLTIPPNVLARADKVIK
jgi:putative ABC transport system substrate-binding protein